MNTVMVADDEPHLRLLVSATLASTDYTIVEAADGHSAWELIQQHHPAVALLDVRMPGPDGVEICRRLKSDPATAGTTVIILTAYGQPADRERGLAAGADAYLTKPFSPLELLRLVSQAIEKKTLS